ncbi:hypothetical protein ANCDUO_25197 [Ancylostoma duodenale]|uniref:Uncharacterized protein n=1 Tax=Ancylostoma duodenale TaxID=51022 RepID=A0A0C2F8G2_9BILA|nr:hypothetical protein ANCDUO_25197 [Ancylostoma duodenale]
MTVGLIQGVQVEHIVADGDAQQALPGIATTEVNEPAKSSPMADAGQVKTALRHWKIAEEHA